MQGENISEASLHTSARGVGWKVGVDRNSRAGYKGEETKVSRLLKKGGRGAQTGLEGIVHYQGFRKEGQRTIKVPLKGGRKQRPVLMGEDGLS